MAETRTHNLVSTDWLGEHLDAPDIVVIDASWHLPPAGRNGGEEFLEEHIPGALFFDIDALSDAESSLPHMLPSPEKFASRMRKMGIGDGNRVIAYDSVGLFSAARAWWMFRVMGHHDVAILDGGLPKWKAEARPLETGSPRPRQERHFTARLQTMMVKDKADVLSASGSSSTQIVDARAAARYEGTAPEPREGLRSGHIPGSFNLPFDQLLKDDGTVVDDDAIRNAFAQAGLDVSSPAITSCGSGITAAVLSLGLTIIGAKNHALYDGSWTDWGADKDVPVNTGSKP